VWKADQYFYGGGTWRRVPPTISGTSIPFLFEYQRTGDFEYRIPLKPGVYELHLFFCHDSDNLTTFSVAINGNSVLQGFDVNADALGDDVADERVFRDISPDKDGFFRIRFSGEIGGRTLNAIEIQPGIPHKQLPIRLLMQYTAFTDRSGQLWRPDNYFVTDVGILRAGPLFRGTLRPLHLYAIPVDTRGRYTLVLHFAEFYFGPQASGAGGVGSRVFRVMCNGETLLDNFDII
jgi:hypothetical protein